MRSSVSRRSRSHNVNEGIRIGPVGTVVLSGYEMVRRDDRDDDRGERDGSVSTVERVRSDVAVRHFRLRVVFTSCALF